MKHHAGITAVGSPRAARSSSPVSPRLGCSQQTPGARASAAVGPSITLFLEGSSGCPQPLLARARARKVEGRAAGFEGGSRGEGRAGRQVPLRGEVEAEFGRVGGGSWCCELRAAGRVGGGVRLRRSSPRRREAARGHRSWLSSPPRAQAAPGPVPSARASGAERGPRWGSGAAAPAARGVWPSPGPGAAPGWAAGAVPQAQPHPGAAEARSRAPGTGSEGVAGAEGGGRVAAGQAQLPGAGGDGADLVTRKSGALNPGDPPRKK